MADKEQAVAQFTEITGCAPEQASFFLEANNWNLEAATSSYFEAGGQQSADSSPEQPFTTPSSSSSHVPNTQSIQKDSKKAPVNNSRVRTFQDIISGNAGDGDSSDDDQNYFAGGEKSGIMMKGGPKNNANENDLVKNILEKAAKSGAAPEEFQAPTAQPNFFGGAGYRLGSEDEPAATQAAPQVNEETSPQAPEPVERHLTFWRNGFSIDDGPLRTYEDPESQEFLRAINNGRAPTHLLNVAYDQPVEVKVTRNLDQDYVPPAKKPTQAFSGSGQRLGGISSPEEGASLPGGFPGASSSTAAPAPLASFTVDESLPVTSIQIRLADGTRLITKINHTQTVGDIRNFVSCSRPEMTSRRWILQTSYPVKELADDKQTIKEAGLINAVIVQRWV